MSSRAGPAAFAWLSSHRFWDANSYQPCPEWLEPNSTRNPRIIAAFFATMFNYRYLNLRIAKYTQAIEVLEAAARNETDAFYRYRFDTVAQRARTMLLNLANRFDPSEFRSEFDDDDDYDDDNYSENEVPCDCPACQAKRAKARARRSEQPKASTEYQPSFIDDLDDEEEDLFDNFEDDEEFFAAYFEDTGRDFNEEFRRATERATPELKTRLQAVEQILRALGAEGIQELNEVVNAMESGDTPVDPLKLITLFDRFGLGPDDLLVFMETMPQIEHLFGSELDETNDLPTTGDPKFQRSNPAESAASSPPSGRQRGKSPNKQKPTKKR
jgi:hypothetical protein